MFINLHQEVLHVKLLFYMLIVNENADLLRQRLIKQFWKFLTEFQLIGTFLKQSQS